MLGYNPNVVNKRDIEQVVEALPAEASLDDAMHALYLRALIDRAERDIREGRTCTHEQAKQRLAKWLR